MLCLSVPLNPCEPHAAKQLSASVFLPLGSASLWLISPSRFLLLLSLAARHWSFTLSVLTFPFFSARSHLLTVLTSAAPDLSFLLLFYSSLTSLYPLWPHAAKGSSISPPQLRLCLPFFYSLFSSCPWILSPFFSALTPSRVQLLLSFILFTLPCGLTSLPRQSSLGFPFL